MTALEGKSDGSNDVNFEEAKDIAADDRGDKDDSVGNVDNNDDDDDDGDDDDEEEDDQHLMVIETPEGLTLVEPAENSSFYIVQENEGQETPPSMTKMLWFLRGPFFYIYYGKSLLQCCTCNL